MTNDQFSAAIGFLKDSVSVGWTMIAELTNGNTQCLMDYRHSTYERNEDLVLCTKFSSIVAVIPVSEIVSLKVERP